MIKQKAFRKRDLFILRAAINGFAAGAREIRNKEILPSKELERYKAWDRKRSMGLQARAHLLAYAYLLGMKYSDVEPNRPLNQKYWSQTESLARQVLKVCELYGGYRVYWCKDLNQDAIVNWFKTDENIFVWDPPTKPKSDNTKSLTDRLKDLGNAVLGKTNTKNEAA